MNASTKISSKSYYPFGMVMPGRSYSTTAYKWGFNGKEKDGEIKGDGNSLDFGARIYDSRLGRWLSLDPLQAKYADWSPYNFTLCSPIQFLDKDGKDVYVLIYTSGAPEFKKAAEFRANQIKKQASYNEEKDHVYVLHISNFDNIELEMKTVGKDANSNGFGETVELGIWSHAGPVDGPAGDERTNEIAGLSWSGQLSKSTWSNIDFNFNSKNSTASFYGCRTVDFAKNFLKWQPKLARAAGQEGFAYPSTSAFEWIPPTKPENANYFVGIKSNYINNSGRNALTESYLGITHKVIPMRVFDRAGRSFTTYPNLQNQNSTNTLPENKVVEPNLIDDGTY